MTRARSERRSMAMSRHSTAASRSTLASIRSASRRRCSARGSEGGPVRKSFRRCVDRKLGLTRPAPRDLGEQLLVDRRQIRERSVARHALPPMKWSGETSTPSTWIRSFTPSSRRRASRRPPSCGRRRRGSRRRSRTTRRPTAATQPLSPAISSAAPGRRSGTSWVTTAYAASRDGTDVFRDCHGGVSFCKRFPRERVPEA